MLAYVLVVVVFAFGQIQQKAVTDRLRSDEHNFISNGIATTTCLLEVFRNVAPLLRQSPNVQQPLESFLILQGRRYGEHFCPSPAEAQKITRTLPTVK